MSAPHATHVVTATLASGATLATWEGAATSHQDAAARARAAIAIAATMRTDGRPMDFALRSTTRGARASAAFVQRLTLEEPLILTDGGRDASREDRIAAANMILRILALDWGRSGDRAISVSIGAISQPPSTPRETHQALAQALTATGATRDLDGTLPLSQAMLALTLPKSASDTVMQFARIGLPMSATLGAAFADDLRRTRKSDVATLAGYLSGLGLTDLASEIAREG